MVVGGRREGGESSDGGGWRLGCTSTNRSGTTVWVVYRCSGTANRIVFVGGALCGVWVERCTGKGAVGVRDSEVLKRAILWWILVFLPGGLFGLFGLLLAHWRGLGGCR